MSLIGMLMVWGTPESRSAGKADYRFDTMGVVTFMIAMVALLVVATQGARLGWTSVATLGLLVTGIVFVILFIRVESGRANAFVDFRLFRNRTYSGARLSNLLLNGVAGTLLVAMTLV